MASAVSSQYKLSCVLYGHTLDVRSLAVSQEGYIVSGSRDRTAKVWKPNGVNTGFTEVQTLLGHNNFVSCVCVLPPDSQHPSGLILTGSNDNNIRIFVLDSSQPISVLKGHKNVVCSLTAGVKKGTVISASWDATACVWHADSTAPMLSLSGHQMAVWSAIQLASGDIATGSADKTIRIWLLDGVCQKTLTGHTDCVRSLTPTSANEFLSASNDATIRHWNATQGTCLGTYYGHANYIYCVSVLPQGGSDCFVTSGEDRTIRVWQGGDVEQTLMLPAQSVWAVACLANGDIVTGSSDGVVRVFSRHVERHADPEVLKQFDEQVANMTLSSEQDLGGLKVNELPGKEALAEPGTRDGQTKIVREGASVMCYNWSAENSEWVKVGDVVGASGGSEAASGKVLYNGKEYDYVFSVDIEEGKPPLKLPYNTDEDPWFAAQRFIHANNLNQLFLDQVANFIITNSDKRTPVKRDSSTAAYVDPFTDSGRGDSQQYAAQKSTNSLLCGVPSDAEEQMSEVLSKTPSEADQTMMVDGSLYGEGSERMFIEAAESLQDGSQHMDTGQGASGVDGPDVRIKNAQGGNRYIPGEEVRSGGGVDPYTGGSRYEPSTSGAATAKASSSGSVRSSGEASYFPQRLYVRFDQANTKVILEKLVELNGKVGDEGSKIDEASLNGVVSMGHLGASAHPSHLEVLKQMFEWPQDILFPVLDVTRLAIRNLEVNRELCSGSAGDLLFRYLQQFMLPKASSINQMLALRILSNMLAHPPGEELLLRNRDFLFSALLDLQIPSNKHMQVATATLLLNLAVALQRLKDSEATVRAVKVVMKLFPQLTDAEAQFRALVALGTFLSTAEDSERPVLLSLISSSGELLTMLTQLVGLDSTDPVMAKTSQCAMQVAELIQKAN